MKKLSVICSVILSSLNSVQAARLAERKELKKQLLSVNTGMNQVYLERMYPCILDQAGQEIDPDSLVNLFTRAKNNYLSNLIPKIKRKSKTNIIVHMTKASLIQFTPQLIRAILPDDPNEAGQAIHIYNLNYKYSENPVLPSSKEVMSDI